MAAARMNGANATLFAFVVAAIVPALALALLRVVQTGELRDMVFAIFFAPYSIAATVFLAAPAYLLFRWFRWINLWSTLVSGILIGAMVDVLVGAGTLDPIGSLLMCAIGCLSAGAFWVVRVWLSGVTFSE
ncbi:MAG TPA: hypothetical protein VKR38_03105 [Usitatibacter sp.]|nr:hypothetical protein [Usitatibacter sp.]